MIQNSKFEGVSLSEYVLSKWVQLQKNGKRKRRKKLGISVERTSYSLLKREIVSMLTKQEITELKNLLKEQIKITF
jgi:hypothetical protein